MIRRIVPIVLLVGVALLVALTPTGQTLSQSIQQVIVTNWPRVQTIDGRVAVSEPVPLAAAMVFPEVVVPPVRRTDTTRLVDAGTLVAEGFPRLVLSLHGNVKGSIGRTGAVGAILIPEQVSIQEAFNERGLMHFALDVAATGVGPGTAYFASDQPVYTVGFRSYRVLLYNSTDKTVTTNLYAYLTN